MARERTYAPRNYSSSTAKSFSGSAATKSAQDNRSAYNREKARTTTTTIDPGVKRRNELAMKVAKEKRDAEAFKNYSYTKPTGLAKFSPIAQVIDITGIGKKTFEVNKSYYERNVKGKAKPGGGFYAASVEDFKSYMKGRGSGSIDAMGRTINKGDGGRDFVVEKNVGGKTILTTEKKVAKDAEVKKEYDERTTKKRGRRKTIKTGSLGVTKVSSDYSLGKPTLLGKV